MSQRTFRIMVAIVVCSIATTTTHSIAQTRPEAQVLAVRIGDRAILACGFSPDGQSIAVGTYAGAVQVRNVDDGSVRSQFQFPCVAAGLAWSPDGKYLAVAGTDSDPDPQIGKVLGSIRVWDVVSKEEKLTYDIPNGAVFDVDISASGKTVVATGFYRGSVRGQNGWVKMWRLANGANFQPSMKRQNEPVIKAEFAPDGRSLFGATSKHLYCWQLGSASYTTLARDFHSISDFDVSKDGQHVVIAGDISRYRSGGIASIWDVSSKKPLTTIRIPHSNHSITSVKFSPDGSRVVIGSAHPQAQVVVARVRDGKVLAVHQGHQKPAATVSYSPDGELVASTGDDGTLKIWNASATGNSYWYGGAGQWDGQQLWVIRRGLNTAQLFDSPQDIGEPIALADLDDLTKADLKLTRLSKDDLQHLTQLQHLKSLSLSVNPSLNADLRFLKSFDRLESLDLRDAYLQGNAFDVLVGASKLKSLSMGNSGTRVEQLAFLRSLKSLEKLTLQGREVNSQLIGTLSALEQLNELDISQTRVVVTDLIDFAKFPKLRILRLGRVNESGLKKITELNRLSVLDFDASQCSEDTILGITKMPALATYSIRNSSASQAAIDIISAKGFSADEARIEYCQRMRESIASKLEKVRTGLPEGAFQLDAAISRELVELERQIAWRESMMQRYQPRSRGFGFLGGLRSQAENAGNFAARGQIQEEISNLEARRDRLVKSAKDRSVRVTAGLTKEEIQFGEAFALLK